jgi:death-on-curing protein
VTQYLDLDDALHVVARLGFSVRDAGLLASALARPATTVFGVDAYPSVDEKAAALLDSVSRNHALLDGNKRTAWVLTALFLWLNGLVHSFSTDEAFDLVLGVTTGRIDLEEATIAFREHRVARADS